MTLLSPQDVLGEHFDPDLHRRPAREVDPCHGGHHVADVNRLAEIDFVDRDGHTLAVRVTDGGHSGDAVHEREDVAAEHVAHDVRMMRHHELREHRLRFAGMPALLVGHQ